MPIDLARAGQRAVLRLAAHQLRDAEVGDLDPALLVQQDVLRLDVAVDHAMVVGVLQGLADLRDDGQGLLGRQLAGVQQLAEVQAVDELHEEVVQTALTPGPSPERARGDLTALTPGPSPEYGRGETEALALALPGGEAAVWPKS